MTLVSVQIRDLAESKATSNGPLENSDLVPCDLAYRAEIVGGVASRNAAAVDTEARFPKEALAALREQRLLGLMVPRELGGEGASTAEVADICYRLGRACASTAMIYAMHQTKVACIIRHSCGSAWHERLLRRLASEQLLFASSTTEGQGGGNVRSSQAPIERLDGRISLTRNAAVISYGAQADGVVTTARRTGETSSSDQVLVVFLKEDYTLEPQLAWDTLGMRGTCSAGFMLKAQGLEAQILPDPYDRIHVESMTPTAHLLWASVWAGIATDAVERARGFIRKASRGSGGQLPPGATQFAKASSSLGMLRSLIAFGLTRFEEAAQDRRALAAIDFQAMINLAKVDASELAVATVMTALWACGLSGYRNDGEFSVARHLRDVMSSPLMINNERIIANISTSLLMGGTPASLRG
jgi:acyl-CoA dehydrogenase